MAQFEPSPFRTLAELIRVFGSNRRTCEVRVSGAALTGRVILESGEVVHAVCGSLMGLDALYVMLAESQVILRVHDDPQVTRRTITLGRREILAKAASFDRRDGSRAGVPSASMGSQAAVPAAPDPSGGPFAEPNGEQRLESRVEFYGERPAMLRREATRAMRMRTGPVLVRLPTPEPQDFPAEPEAEIPSEPRRARPPSRPPPELEPSTEASTRSSPGLATPPRSLLRQPWVRVSLLLATAALMVAIFFLGAQSVRPGLPRPPPARSTGSVLGAVEGGSLVGLGDAPPRLLSGNPPRAPAVDQTLAPTIVCRLLVGVDGKVQETRIYQPRLELAPFEEAAVLAVQHYLFSPGLKAGVPVPTWINFPLSFGARSGNAAVVLRIKGSDTIGGALMPELVKNYLANHLDVDVRAEALGSATGFQGLFDGSADLGTSSRTITAEELEQAKSLGLELVEHVIGYDAVALIVNPSNPVQALSLPQLADLYSGKLMGWSEVGGDVRPLTLLGRPSYSGTHKFFLESVLRRGNAKSNVGFAPAVEAVERNEDLVKRVQSDPGAIAYVGLGFVGQGVRSLAISLDGTAPVVPSRETASSGAYPIHRPLMIYARRDAGDAVQGLVNFILSREGQAIVYQSGFVPADPHADPAAPAVALPGSGEGSPAVEPLRLFYGVGSIHPTAADLRRVKEAAAQAKAGNRRFLVVGNGDGRSEAEGPRVALARAQEVERILRHAGVRQEAIETKGASVPVASNRTEEGRAQNRRVDLYLLAR